MYYYCSYANRVVTYSGIEQACIVLSLVFWDVALMMEAVHTSETSINLNVTTRCNIPEDSKLHTRRRENLKSHMHLIA
jgi:hypothetical protein